MRTGVLLLVVCLAGLGLWMLLGDGADPVSTGPSATEGARESTNGAGLVGRPGHPASAAGTQEVPPVDASGAGMDPAEGLRLVGRVVDATRRAVAGATLEVRLGGRQVEAVADATGAYEIPVGAAPDRFVFGTIHARAPDGRIATGPVVLQRTSPARVRLPALVVGPAYSLDIRVRHAGAPVAGAVVVLAARVWGRLTALASGTTTAEGAVTVRGLPRGGLHVFAAKPGLGRMGYRVILPRVADDPIELTLPIERTLTVRVVDAVTTLPVEGAHVHVGDRFTARMGGVLALLPALELPASDASGVVQVGTLNAQETFFVSADAEGYARANPFLAGAEIPVAVAATEVTVPLRRYRTITFPLVKGDTSPPDESAVLRVEVPTWLQYLLAPDASARVERGQLVIQGLPVAWLNGRVVAPDGSFATFTARAGATQGAPVSFKAALAAQVRLIERGGGPVVGARLSWRGGSALGTQAAVLTDAQGAALLTGMRAGRVTVFLLRPGERFGVHRLGEIDVTAERPDHVYVLDVEPPGQITIRVTVAGRRGLPGSYDLRVGAQPVQPEQIEEDPEAGTLVVTARPPAGTGRLRVQLRAAGHVPAEGEVQRGRGAELGLDLVPSAQIHVRVSPPEDGAFRIGFERQDPTTHEWTLASDVSPGGAGRPSPADGSQERVQLDFEVQTAGLLRAFDRVSGLRGEGVDVRLGMESETWLDLSRTVWLEVQVEAPAGVDLRRAWLERDGVRSRTDRVDARGHARVRTVRGVDFELGVGHPVLVGAAATGRRRVQGGAPALVTLHLVIGNTVTFRLPASPGTEAVRAARFMLFRGARFDPGKLVAEGLTVVEDGRHTLGGFDPGTYTLWIDPFVTAPLLLSNRSFGAGNTALGALRPPVGSQVRVKILHGASKAPAVLVVLRRTEPPAMSRSTARRAGDDAAVIVSGLIVGTYTATLRVLDAGGARAEPQTVLIEDTGETKITFDLRR